MFVTIYTASIIAELLPSVFGKLWQLRKVYMALLLPVVAVMSFYPLFIERTAITYILALIGIFRLFNLFRILKGRMHDSYLASVSGRSSVILGIFGTTLVFIWQLTQLGIVSVPSLLAPLVVMQLCGTVLLLVIIALNIRSSRYHSDKLFHSDKELPTLTVAIPARNETKDLEICLKSLLANDYPKLEILVLDDCSQDTTSDIIKSFAQDGVRFIEGKPPSDHWLPKNHAYQVLAEAASGEFIVFCGVDTRFAPQALRELINHVASRKLQMLSVLPRRLTGTSMEAFVQPLRYWWEFALPRKLFGRPAVLSTCWLINRSSLRKLGGFEAVNRSVLPEAYFAKSLVQLGAYEIVRSDDILDIQTTKTLDEQRDTAIRMRYPQLHRRPEWVLLVILGEFVFLLGPFILLIFSALTDMRLLLVVSILTCLMSICSHVLIVAISNPANVPIALVNYPLVIVCELVLGITSMYRYEFSVVDWKGRNICIPIMHVTSHLPRVTSGSE